MDNNSYWEELSRILRKHNVEYGPVENGLLIIQMDGQPVGRMESKLPAPMSLINWPKPST